MSLEGNAEKNMLLNKLTGKIRHVPELDETLTHPDKAANAKITGDAIARVEAKADMMVPNVSKNVTFNGAKSGLEAMNVQDAIDEVHGIVKGMHKWESLATNYVSEVNINIPECDEILCEVVNSNNNAIALTIPYAAINGKTKKYYIGGHVTSSAYFGANIFFANNAVYMKDSYLNGSYDGTARFNVYCKGVR